jgi:hypothetical protein
MFSFRRTVAVQAFLLGFSIAALAHSALGQSSSSSSAPQQDQTQQPASPTLSQGQITVQQRIRARREARRQQAIRDTYARPYEIFIGAGYQRFVPGPALQHVTMYAWDMSISRYWSERLGLTFEGRGNYGTAFVGLNPTSLTRPAISTYDVLVGPTYRFRLRPKYSLAGHVGGGVAMGNFSGDTNQFGTKVLGLYPDGTTYAINGKIIGEANISPSLSLRLAGDYMATGFGSTLQNDFGATFGLVVRFGKQ